MSKTAESTERAYRGVLATWGSPVEEQTWVEMSADLRLLAEEYGAELEIKEGARRAVLVYQAGIANVFEVDCFNMADYGRNARRLLQHAFSPCEFFARGLGAAGWVVRSATCNQAGDIVSAPWSDDLEQAPFSDSFAPVHTN